MKTEVKNDNCLIAEFMGGVKEHPSIYQYYGEGWGDHVWTKLPGITVTPFLDYHKSWDWLMTVVEKIEAMNGKYKGYVFISGKWATADVMVLDGDVVTECIPLGKFECNSRIESVYKAVVEFIRWYNQQPTSNP